MDNQNLIPINTTSDKGALTRVNREKTHKRSIIDYALISKSLANNITERRTIPQTTLNKITKTETIPQERQEGEIITMYKGTGIKS